MLMDLKFMCLQKYPEYIDQCVDLLNAQWPRSKTARMVSIQRGATEDQFPKFPTTFILVSKLDDSVVAHCKVSPIPNLNGKGCFIESVVVTPVLRGQGVGRQIMEKVEDFVKSKGVFDVYLTTYDQQGFYEKLGYHLCDPIVFYGGPQRHSTTSQSGGSHAVALGHPSPQNIADSKSISSSKVIQLDKLNANSGKPKSSENNKVLTSVTLPPPPPPPPMPTKKLTKQDIVHLNMNEASLVKVTMKKSLCKSD